MPLPQDLLTEGKKLKEKFKYTSDPSVVRNPDGSLNFDDDKMDCSEFFLKTVRIVNQDLYVKLIEKLPGSKEGGNTKTIQKGIKDIEGLTDLTDLKQDSPLVGDWVLWKDHIEMIQDVTAGGRCITLGANGATGSAVPKNIDCKNFDSVKKISANFLGIWTPRLGNDLNPILLSRIEALERALHPFNLSNNVEIASKATDTLKDAAAFALAPPISDLKTPVHLRTNNINATLKATAPTGQAFPLFEGAGMPFNTSDDVNIKIRNITSIIDYLRVSKMAHKRYLPTNSDTFCNIYAYDLCYLMGFDIGKYYIPRVWWTNAAVTNINNGIPQVPNYGTTLREMSANDLHHWFEVFGVNFGWLKSSNPDALQEFVNTTGDVGIIVGRKPGGHGHITVVVPEQSAQPAEVFSAVRNVAGKVINPLQSQAGSRNFEYGNLTIGANPWFLSGEHISAMYIFNLL